MASKKETAARGKAVKVKQIGKTIVFQATRALTEEDFSLLSDVVRREAEKSGIKIVLMPFSCELVEADQDTAEKDGNEQ